MRTVAVVRGPLVYCAEGIDNPDFSIRDVRVENPSDFQISMEEICQRAMPVLNGPTIIRKDFQELYRFHRQDKEQTNLKLIPYFAWANRGVTEMNVWFLKN